MAVSVCIATYNGKRFVESQLLSIMKQTRQPDEVILCDDRSEDGTAEMVREFIDRHDLKARWRLVENQENRGYPKNFYYAMGLCKGDVVFLGDQDDVWEETKIERMLSVFDQCPAASVVACKFGLIDGEGRKIRAVTAPSHSLETGRIGQIKVRDIFYKYQWPGMVLAYRNGWYQEFWKEAMGESNIPHDIFLCARAAEEGAFFQLDEELAYHRRHESNTAAEEHRIGKLLHRDRKLWEIKKYLEMLKNFEQYEVLQTQEGAGELRKKLQVMEGRYEALLSRRISRVLGQALANRKNVRLATVLCDVLIAKRKI